MSEDVAGKKFVIVGTAPTWRMTPWDDPSAVIACLNDMHLMKPPRADRWYDLHPFGQFFYRDPNGGKLHAVDVPAGMFVRPAGHLAWLAAQSIPVYVQTADPRVPRARVFPRDAIEAKFGPWFDSTPAWMLGHALLEGYREIHIYGIHLQTEAEYQKQKPNMSYLCGLARGLGVKVVVPPASPLLRPTHRYAYEPDPAVPVLEAHRQRERLVMERKRVEQDWRRTRHWWRRGGDRALRDRLTWLGAQTQDAELAAQWHAARKRALA